MTAVSDLLDGLEAAAKAATPGPWKQDLEGGSITAGDIYAAESMYGVAVADPADAACIVAEHNAAPQLVAALRAVLALADEWERKGYSAHLSDAIRAAVASALGSSS